MFTEKTFEGIIYSKDIQEEGLKFYVFVRKE